MAEATEQRQAPGVRTVVPGVLTVGSALPDPPFELLGETPPRGFDVALTRSIADHLGLQWHLVRFDGANFNDIFALLGRGEVDGVASGATITPDRERVATFCAPYLRSGQSLVCDPRRTPQVRSVDDLSGLTLGVQEGNTSEPVARELVARGAAADVKVYAYHAIGSMLDDVRDGRIAAAMKLAPVMRWLLRDRPELSIVQEDITTEDLAISVALGNDDLRTSIDSAQAWLRSTGELARLTTEWIGP